VSEKDAASQSVWDLDSVASFTVVFNLALLGLILAGTGVVHLVQGGAPVVRGVVFLVLGLAIDGAVAAKVVKARRSLEWSGTRSSQTSMHARLATRNLVNS